MERRELFCGAMSAEMPQGWMDISQVRDIPDNQEVYASVNPSESISGIIEIVEHDTEVPNDKCGDHFCTGLIADNGDDYRTQIKNSGYSIVKNGMNSGIFGKIEQNSSLVQGCGCVYGNCSRVYGEKCTGMC